MHPHPGIDLDENVFMSWPIGYCRQKGQVDIAMPVVRRGQGTSDYLGLPFYHAPSRASSQQTGKVQKVIQIFVNIGAD